MALLDSGHWSERWAHRPRLPLGDAYSGVCRAADAAHEPPEADQRDLCNHGYARGRCPHFPADADADAVRFSVIAAEPLRLVYIFEKDGAPVEHGELDPQEPVPRPPAANSPLLAHARLLAQARAFVASYRRIAASEPPAQSSSASSRG